MRGPLIPGSKDLENGRGSLPDLLQAVKFPLLRGKDVNDDVAQVKQHPAGVSLPLPPIKRKAFLGNDPVNFVADGLNLTLALPAAEDEIIGKTTSSPKVQEEYIKGLLVEGRFYDLLG